MAEQEIPKVIFEILEKDARYWPKLSNLVSSERTLMDLRIVGNDRDDCMTQADKLVDELKMDGFEAIGSERGYFQKSLHGVWEFLEAIVTISGAVSVGGKVKAWLQENRNKNIEIDHYSAIGLQWIVGEWLDKKYGSKNWKYDPDLFQAKKVAKAWIVDFVELNSSARHLLYIEGEKVEEISPDLRKNSLRP